MSGLFSKRFSISEGSLGLGLNEALNIQLAQSSVLVAEKHKERAGFLHDNMARAAAKPHVTRRKTVGAKPAVSGNQLKP